MKIIKQTIQKEIPKSYENNKTNYSKVDSSHNFSQ